MQLRHQLFLKQLVKEHPRLWINPKRFENEEYMFELRYKGITGFLVIQITEEPLLAIFGFEKTNPHEPLQYEAISYTSLEGLLREKLLPDIEYSQRLRQLYAPPEEEFDAYFRHLPRKAALQIREYFLKTITNDVFETALALAMRKAEQMKYLQTSNLFFVYVPWSHELFICGEDIFYHFPAEDYQDAQDTFMKCLVPLHHNQIREFFSDIFQ